MTKDEQRVAIMVWNESTDDVKREHHRQQREWELIWQDQHTTATASGATSSMAAPTTTLTTATTTTTTHVQQQGGTTRSTTLPAFANPAVRLADSDENHTWADNDNAPIQPTATAATTDPEPAPPPPPCRQLSLASLPNDLSELFNDHIDQLFVEICARPGSALQAYSPPNTVVVQVTEQDDVLKKSSFSLLQRLVMTARTSGIFVSFWFSPPCTAYSPLQQLNKAQGRAQDLPRQQARTQRILRQLTAITRMATEALGLRVSVTWEWSARCRGWKTPAALGLLQAINGEFVTVNGCAVAAHVYDSSNKLLRVGKAWTLATNCPALRARMSHLRCRLQPHHVHAATQGPTATASAYYTPAFAWRVHLALQDHLKQHRELLIEHGFQPRTSTSRLQRHLQGLERRLSDSIKFFSSTAIMDTDKPQHANVVMPSSEYDLVTLPPAGSWEWRFGMITCPFCNVEHYEPLQHDRDAVLLQGGVDPYEPKHIHRCRACKRAFRTETALTGATPKLPRPDSGASGASEAMGAGTKSAKCSGTPVAREGTGRIATQQALPSSTFRAPEGATQLHSEEAQPSAATPATSSPQQASTGAPTRLRRARAALQRQTGISRHQDDENYILKKAPLSKIFRQINGDFGIPDLSTENSVAALYQNYLHSCAALQPDEIPDNDAPYNDENAEPRINKLDVSDTEKGGALPRKVLPSQGCVAPCVAADAAPHLLAAAAESRASRQGLQPLRVPEHALQRQELPNSAFVPPACQSTCAERERKDRDEGMGKPQHTNSLSAPSFCSVSSPLSFPLNVEDQGHVCDSTDFALMALAPALVTRLIKPGSPESKSPAAREAIRKEMAKMHRVWNPAEVREWSEVKADARFADAMMGGLFVLLGEKAAEDGGQATIKARAVFRGDVISTKSGVAAHLLFQEVASSPAAMQTSRAIMAIAALRGWDLTIKDAEQAFLQSPMDQATRTTTFVRLPRDLWPPEWFDARGAPRFRVPVVPLHRALYGHPESPGLWEKYFARKAHRCHWTPLERHPGTFVHGPSGAMMVTYVDDILLLSPSTLTEQLWAELEDGDDGVLFKEAKPQQVSKYLGVHHVLRKEGTGGKDTSCTFHMQGYMSSVVADFERDWGILRVGAMTPYLPDQPDSLYERPGTMKGTPCISFLMRLLFAARMCRPDLLTAVVRLAARVSKWAAADDRQLTRLMAYVKHTTSLSLVGRLGLGHSTTVELHAWPDADLAGSRDHTRSTSGLWLELLAPGCDEGSPKFQWPLMWHSRKQGVTAASTCESETISLSVALRREALPAQELLSVALGRPVLLVVHEDNEQCISAVRKRFSPALRHLGRTQRISLGVLHESLCGRSDACLRHSATAEHKGDLFTKALDANAFYNALRRIGMVPLPSGDQSHSQGGCGNG